MINNLEDLTRKVKYLAKVHAYTLINQKEKKNPTAKGEFKLKEIANTLLSVDFLKALDKAAVLQTINELEKSVNDLVNWTIVIESKKIKKPMPIVFDALVEIFVSSNEKFRQQYVHQLTTLYYEEFCENLQNLKSEPILDKVNYSKQLKILLPLIKIMSATIWSQDRSWSKEDEGQLFSNISRYFRFPRINQEDVYEVVRNKISSSNFILESYELTPLDEKNGHLGEYFQLKIEVNAEEEVQQFRFFAKFLTPKTEGMKKMVLSGPSVKEEFFYITYMPLLEKYGLKSILNFAPKYYFSRVYDVIILDDMTANGFIGLTPNNLLKYDVLEKVVKKMAHFHAATMILEEKLSQEKGKRITVYDVYSEFLQEAFFVPDDDYFLKPNFDIGVETMSYVASKFPEITKKFSEEFLKEKINVGWKLHFEKVRKSEKFKNTMCHGDMYVANILFKFNQEKICDDVSLIDFQILRYCPPTHDLMFFLYQSCTKEDRNKYLTKLCYVYYEQLSNLMSKFGLDGNKVYPKEDFENSLKYIKSQAVFQALFYTPVTITPPKLREEIFSSQEQAQYYLYKNRRKLVDFQLEDDISKTVFKGLVEDLVELCENGDL